MRTFNQSTEKKGLPAVCPDSFVLKGPKYLKVAKKFANLGKFYYQRIQGYNFSIYGWHQNAQCEVSSIIKTNCGSILVPNYSMTHKVKMILNKANEQTNGLQLNNQIIALECCKFNERHSRPRMKRIKKVTLN